MAIFEYQCNKCGFIFEEIFTKNIDKISTECKNCKGIAKKIMSKSNFKVNGFSSSNNYSKRDK